LRPAALHRNSEESCNSKQIFAAKERKEDKEKNLCCFLFAIFVFFCGQLFLLRLCGAVASAPFCGKSIEMPFHQGFTSHGAALPIQSNPVQSRLIKVNQGIF